MPIIYLTPEYHARAARLGCLGLVLLLGMVVGNIFFVIQNWRVSRYIDEGEAVRIGGRFPGKRYKIYIIGSKPLSQTGHVSDGGQR